jgi:hypothetical protein
MGTQARRNGRSIRRHRVPERRKLLRSDMGWSDATQIRVQGIDLVRDIMGKLDLGQFAFLEIQGRLPTGAESVVFNAMLCTLVEHGMTPMAIATRLTYLGAPESLQGPLPQDSGSGQHFAGTAEESARLLHEALDGELRICPIPRRASSRSTWSPRDAKSGGPYRELATTCTSRRTRAPYACSKSPPSTASVAATCAS